MRAWSDRPFEPVTPLSGVTARGAVIAEANGQSQIIYECADHPGWLVKLYHRGLCREPDATLDRLIALPSAMRPGELALVDSSICWPVSRIVEEGPGGATVGVIFAKAPKEFSAPLRLLTGKVEDHPLELDHLVQDDPGFYRQRGWPEPSFRERMLVSRNLLAVSALFERHELVYGDWSYANVFWSRESGRVFVIDMDACGFGDHVWVESPGWDDPLVPAGSRLDVRTDRYKVAVAVARALTGVRASDPCAAHEALPEPLRISAFGTELLAGITDPMPLRPLSAGLLELLEVELDDPSHGRPAPAPAAVSKPVASEPVVQPVVLDLDDEYVPEPTAEYVPEQVEEHVPESEDEYVPEPEEDVFSDSSEPFDEPDEYVPFNKPEKPGISRDQLLTTIITCGVWLLPLLALAALAALLLP